MTVSRVRAGDLFDGHTWLGPATVHHEEGHILAVEPAPGIPRPDADVVLPGLVDCGVNAQGYLEGPAHGMPFLPEDAFAALCVAAGVLTVVDLGNDLGPLGHLSEVAERGDGPRVVSSVCRGVTRPARRWDRPVAPAGVAGHLDLLEAAGAPLVACGDLDATTLALLVPAAWQRELTIVVSRSLADAAPGLLFATGPWTGVPGFPAYPAIAESAVGGARATGLDGTWFAPQLEAGSRWSVDGLLNAPDATRARAFLPYARHFQKPRGLVGRRIGRDVLTRLYGDRDPDAVYYPVSEWTQRFLSAGRCLASSGAGSPGLVPGESLWVELTRLESVCGTAGALQCASGATQDLTRGWTSGLLAVGRPADLLLIEGASRHSTIAQLRSGLRHVVVRGRARDVTEVEARLDELNGRFEEALL